MKIEIRNHFSGSVLFTHEAKGNTLKTTLEAAVKAEVDLTDVDLFGADLDGARLDGANLSGANLHVANLVGARLDGARLDGANLSGANLCRVSLDGARLDGARLDGAYLKNGEKLLGMRPIFQISPIGSRCACLTAYLTDEGLRFDIGCQHQITRDVFEQRLADEHGDNIHAKEYRAALALIEAHAELWTPKKDENTRAS